MPSRAQVFGNFDSKVFNAFLDELKNKKNKNLNSILVDISIPNCSI